MGRATVSKTVGCWFESSHLCQMRVNVMLEQLDTQSKNGEEDQENGRYLHAKWFTAVGMA